MPHSNPLVTSRIRSTFQVLSIFSIFVFNLVIIFSINDGHKKSTILYCFFIILSYFLYYLMLHFCDKTSKLQRNIVYKLLQLSFLATIIFIILYYDDSYVLFGISSLWLILFYQFITIFLLIRPCNAIIKQFSYNLNDAVDDIESQGSDYEYTNELDNTQTTVVSL